MTVNKFRISLKPNEQYINIPIEIDWDAVGREDLIQEYEQDVVEKVINPIEDFEVNRFSHLRWLDIQNDVYKTVIDYNFKFYDYGQSVTTSSASNWLTSYTASTGTSFSGRSFTNKEIYFYVNSFKNSFFKLDFYDNPDPANQKIYFTIIIPTQQGLKTSTNIGSQRIQLQKIVDVNIPNFNLDFVGDKEGFFVYWLKDISYYNITEFYMSAKFFNAKIGEFVRFLNRPQSQIIDPTNFPPQDYFYYKLDLNYNSHEYGVYKTYGNLGRVGTKYESINWYEYVNP